MKRRLERIAKEYSAVEVTLNEDSSAPTIEHLAGSSAYDIYIGSDRLVTVSVYVDGSCKNVFLRAWGQLYGHSGAHCTASDSTFESMTSNIARLLRTKLRRSA